MSADGVIATGGSGNLRPFKPGQSGNPSGLSKARAKVEKYARQNCVEAMETIVELMRSAEDERTRLAAAIEVKHTAIGRPKARDLTAEEIDRLVDKRIAELARKAHEAMQQGALDVTPEVP